MTDSYHYQILNRGEMEVLADGGVRWCGQYSGDMYHLSAEKVRERGVMSAQQFAEESRDLNGYKIVRATVGPFPSGATLKVASDKIVGRVEAETAESLPDCPQCGYGPAYCNCKYLRAPLPHFNQRTEFDPFPDYVVFHEFEPVAPLHTSPTTDSAYPAIAGLLRG